MTYLPPTPTWATKTRIQAATEKFAAHNNISVKYPLVELVKSLGGKIKYKSYKGEAIDSESITIDGPNSFVIYLATDTSPLRDRFTIAHELGHYFLHYPVVCQKNSNAKMAATRFVDESSKELIRAEWEANWFAAALLMPSERFREEFRRFNGNLELISEEFEVTTVAAEIRAKTLNLQE